MTEKPKPAQQLIAKSNLGQLLYTEYAAFKSKILAADSIDDVMKCRREVEAWGKKNHKTLDLIAREKKRVSYREDLYRRVEHRLHQLMCIVGRNQNLLRREVKELTGQLNVLQRNMDEFMAKWKLIDEHRAFKTLDAIHAKVRRLSAKSQLEMFKSIVLGEVVRVHPETLEGMLIALDQPDEWWEGRNTLTIGAWRKVLNRLTHQFHQERKMARLQRPEH